MRTKPTPTKKRSQRTSASRMTGLRLRPVQAAAFGALCMVAAFGIGLQTAGDVRTYDTSEAAVQETVEHAAPGDVDADGELEISDAMAVLAFADGLSDPMPDELRRADFDGDGQVTTKDVMRVLHALSLR